MDTLRENDRILSVWMGPHTKLPVTAQTGYQEVIPGLTESSGACGSPKIDYNQFSRIIDVCCIAEMLRNFNIASLEDEEISRFLELQSFFIGLEARCLDEAGFE